MNNSIRLNHFENLYDNLVHNLGDLTWSELCELFSEPHLPVAKKEHVALFNLVRYQEVNALSPLNDNVGELSDGTIVPKRRGINLLQVDALILDYDGGITIDEAKDRFNRYEYLGYTSYNHLKDGETHKFRIIFPLTQPIPVIRLDQTLPVYSELTTSLGKFAGPCDPVVFRPNQHYYVPAAHHSRLKNAAIWFNKGKILDWSEWEVDQPIPTDENRYTYANSGHISLEPDTEFETQEGIIKAKDVTKTYQKVKCPFHDDHKGGEFIKRFDDSGVIHFHCKKCGGFSLYPQKRTVNEDKIEDKYSKPQYQGISKQALEDWEWDIPSPHYFRISIDPSEIKRDKIRKSLEQIANQILLGLPQAHILYMPEGAGKSQLAIDIVRRGTPVIFACQTWEQVYQKQKEFQEKLQSDDPSEHINVLICNSFESSFIKRWKTKTIRIGDQEGYTIREIDKEATIQLLLTKYPNISEAYIDLWWELFSKNPDRISQMMYKTMEQHQLMTVEYNDNLEVIFNEWSTTNKTTGMVITTFSQIRLLRHKKDFIPNGWIVWFDDPGIDDVANITPVETDENSDLYLTQNPEENIPLTIDNIPNRYRKKEVIIDPNISLTDSYSAPTEYDKIIESPKVRTIYGVDYHTRNYSEQLGFSTRYNPMVFTTTEILTKEALIQLLIKINNRRPKIHEHMDKVPYGNITVLGTEKVTRRFDAIIPIMLRKMQKEKTTVQLIADGLGSNFNHINSKGLNTLTDTHILVEVSVPHPKEVRKVCDVLGLTFSTHKHEITLNIMLDKIHQAVGRNSGYRWNSKECIVLVDKKYHKEIIEKIRYEIDDDNSVIIDRTAKMSSQQKRINPYASHLTKTIETYLNNPDKIFNDGRSVTHSIDFTIKQIQDSEKIIKYIARLLTALTTLSKIKLDTLPDTSKPEPSIITTYRNIWDYIQNTWVNDSNRVRILKEYESNLKTPPKH